MLYVQQSLGPHEEILMGARFHWMYTLHAIFWIMFGLALGIAMGYAAIWFDISEEIRHRYGDLPDDLRQTAWNAIVADRGGYLKLVWQLNVIMRMGILTLFMVGLYFFAHMMLVKATTEIAVTNERLIYKKGLVARHVGELNIDRIEGVSVQQGVLGRFFNYGRVCIRGMGVGEVMLPTIENPIEFRKAVNEAKSILDRGGNHRSKDDF